MNSRRHYLQFFPQDAMSNSTRARHADRGVAVPSARVLPPRKQIRWGLFEVSVGKKGGAGPLANAAAEPPSQNRLTLEQSNQNSPGRRALEEAEAMVAAPPLPTRARIAGAATSGSPLANAAIEPLSQKPQTSEQSDQICPSGRALEEAEAMATAAIRAPLAVGPRRGA